LGKIFPPFLLLLYGLLQEFVFRKQHLAMAATADLSRGPVLLSVSVGTATFAFSTSLVRFCVRKRISNNVGMDDYAMAVASVSRRYPQGLTGAGPEISI